MAARQASVEELQLQMRQQDWALWAQKLASLEQSCGRTAELSNTVVWVLLPRDGCGSGSRLGGRGCDTARGWGCARVAVSPMRRRGAACLLTPHSQ